MNNLEHRYGFTIRYVTDSSITAALTECTFSRLLNVYLRLLRRRFLSQMVKLRRETVDANGAVRTVEGVSVP